MGKKRGDENSKVRKKEAEEVLERDRDTEKGAEERKRSADNMSGCVTGGGEMAI